jgi:flagellar motor switch protein FliG
MPLSGREKATIFLSILGADVASRILRYLPDELSDLIAAGVNHLPTPSPAALSEVLSDYQGFLALPPAQPEMVLEPPAPRRSYTSLFYERPQLVAFLLARLPEEEKNGALQALSRERGVIEELSRTLRPNSLWPKLQEQLEEVFKGKLF